MRIYLKKKNKFFKIKEKLVEGTFLLCALISIFTTAGIILVLVFESYEFFKEVSLLEFFTDTQWTPLFAEKHFGILPLISGTFLTSAIAILVSLPLGLIIAIFLSEFTSPGVRNIIKPAMELLSAIPTVVYGYFALLFVTPLLQKIIPDLAGFNALSPGIVMGLMILPIISSLSEDAMQAVPLQLREGGFALGATRLQVATSIVIPSALSGIASSVILAVSRAVGETMVVAIAAGQQPNLTLNPLVPIETVTAYIVQISLGDTPAGTIEYRTIFTAGLTLFVITFIFNIMSFWLKKKFRETYA